MKLSTSVTSPACPVITLFSLGARVSGGSGASCVEVCSDNMAVVGVFCTIATKPEIARIERVHGEGRRLSTQNCGLYCLISPVLFWVEIQLELEHFPAQRVLVCEIFFSRFFFIRQAGI